jgi:hypothetical protein
VGELLAPESISPNIPVALGVFGDIAHVMGNITRRSVAPVAAASRPTLPKPQLTFANTPTQRPGASSPLVGGR